MKKITLPILCTLLATSLSGCGLMEDAFKAGFVIALILAALVGLLVWILRITFQHLSKYFQTLQVFDGFWDE